MDWEKLLLGDRFRPSTRMQGQKMDGPGAYFDKRNEFESDLGRIMFSPAVRRMHDKTQVFPLTSDDNIHTRLTHSIEVQSVSQSLGINLCTRKDFIDRLSNQNKDLIRIIPVILSSIALCHDIGNPPFGHFGERVISSFFESFFSANKSINLTEAEKRDFTMFNGNAQGFRVLSRLQFLQDIYGLNLTIGTLCAYLKYPNLSEEINPTKEDYKNKLGVFQSEKEFIFKIREMTGQKNYRHPLAFLMEAADSICYLVMDMEDGFNKRLYDFDSILKFITGNGDEGVNKIIESYLQKIKDLGEINKNTARMVTLRTFLLQELVNQTIENFIKNIEEIECGNFTGELIFMDEKGLGKTLKKFSKKVIFKDRDIQTLEITGESVLKGLLNHFVPDFIYYKDEKSSCGNRAEKLYSLISNSIKYVAQIQTGQNDLYKMPDYYKLRMIVDYITGMTDSFALNLYQKLEGIKIA